MKKKTVAVKTTILMLLIGTVLLYGNVGSTAAFMGNGFPGSESLEQSNDEFTVTLGQNKTFTTYNTHFTDKGQFTPGKGQPSIQQTTFSGNQMSAHILANANQEGWAAAFLGVDVDVAQGSGGVNELEAKIAIKLNYKLNVDFNVPPPSEGGGGSADSQVLRLIAGNLTEIDRINFIHNSNSAQVNKPETVEFNLPLKVGQRTSLLLQIYTHGDIGNGGYADSYAEVTLEEISISFQDTTSPNTSYEFSGKDSNAILITFTATDDISGVDYTEYSTNGGTTWQRGTQFSFSLSQFTDIQYRSADRTGNVEQARIITIRELSTSPKKFPGVLYVQNPAGGYFISDRYDLEITLHYFEMNGDNGSVVFLDKVKTKLTLDKDLAICDCHTLQVDRIRIYSNPGWFQSGKLVKVVNNIQGGWVARTYTAEVENLGVVNWNDPPQKYRVEIRLIINWVQQKYPQVRTVFTPEGVLFEFLNYQSFPTDLRPTNSSSYPTIGSIMQSQVISNIVPIDPTVAEATFDLRWPGSDLDLVLYAPNGGKIDPQNAASNVNVDFSASNTSETYVVQNPVPGNWTMEFTAADVPVTGEEYFTVAYMSTDLVLELSTDKITYEPDEQVLITTTVLSNTLPLTNVLVTAQIQRPDGVTNTINLYDDGTHRDTVAGDGIFSGEYTNITEGTYDIFALASGSIGDYQFERGSYTTILVEHTVYLPLILKEYP